MSSNQPEYIELAIWKEIANTSLSVSHDHWHIDRVMKYAYQLQSIYGGDLEVITAAVILHDLGRSDPRLHGQDSITESIGRARKILERISLSSDKIELTMQAINEHDKPEVRPSTIEGRILKDADFLGGFGAWGILRIGMWAGESGGDTRQILERLEQRMPRRVDHLEFAESIQLAREEMLFTNLFLALLRRPPKLQTKPWKGNYIVLEGISGSGKDTQADRLEKRLEACGHNIVRVHEPTEEFRELRDFLRAMHPEQQDDPMTMRFLLMIDRHEQMQRIVLPALGRGDTVISVRSFISTLVYQCTNMSDAAATAYMHCHFVPLPDMLVLFDVDANTAWSRIKNRDHRGSFERTDLLEKHRGLYRDICNGLFRFRLRVVDASQPVDEIEEQTWRSIEPLVRRRGT
jgi:dTMP kinase